MLSLQIFALRWGRVSHCRTYVSPEKTATGKGPCNADKCSKKQNIAGTEVSDWHKSDTTGISGVADSANENPGALAGATEVKDVYEATQLPGNSTPKRGKSAMSKWAKPAHKRVAKAIGFVLTLGFTGNRAAQLTTIFSARLNDEEKAGIAYAALRSMDDQDAAYQTASLALFGVFKGEAVR